MSDVIIEFYLKNNKLYKQDSEQTISQNATNVEFAFKLDDEWKQYKLFCLIKTKEFIYRLDLTKKEDLFVCELPDKASSFSFIKVSLYGINNDERITSNELIIPIDRGGYLEYKPVIHHDRFHHHGTHHYHHDFPHHYPPVKTKHHHHHEGNPHHHHHEGHPPHDKEDEHPHHHHHGKKPPFDWDMNDKRRIYFNKIHKHHHHHDHPRYELVGDSVWDKRHVDIFDFILHEIKDSINNVMVDNDKVYAYHNEKLLQVIPLPDYVTREELDYFLGDLVNDINFFENGDVIITRSAFNE